MDAFDELLHDNEFSVEEIQDYFYNMSPAELTMVCARALPLPEDVMPLNEEIDIAFDRIISQ